MGRADFPVYHYRFDRIAMESLSIEPRRAQDGDELLRLYREVFGEDLAEGSRRRWQWQYLENPVRGSNGPVIWIAREGDAVLGQYASMPVRLHWGGREVSSSWGMDVFLRPQARGKGIGAKLFTTWSEHVEVALGLGLTPSSYGLFKKLGYHDVGPVPFYQKVLDPAAVARRRLGTGLGALAAPLLGLGLRLVAPERHRDASGVEVREVAGFSAEYDALWDRTASSYAMCVRRDAAYLDWKYVRCPHQRYTLLEARRDGLLSGFAVSRHQDYRGLRLGWIVDLFAGAGDQAIRDALLGEALERFRQAGVARAQCFALNRALGEDLRARGFLPAASPMQFCVSTRVESVAVLTDLARWHVVFGDSDMDR